MPSLISCLSAFYRSLLHFYFQYIHFGSILMQITEIIEKKTECWHGRLMPLAQFNLVWWHNLCVNAVLVVVELSLSESISRKCCQIRTKSLKF